MIAIHQEWKVEPINPSDLIDGNSEDMRSTISAADFRVKDSMSIRLGFTPL